MTNPPIALIDGLVTTTVSEQQFIIQATKPIENKTAPAKIKAIATPKKDLFFAFSKSIFPPPHINVKNINSFAMPSEAKFASEPVEMGQTRAQDGLTSK